MVSNLSNGDVERQRDSKSEQNQPSVSCRADEFGRAVVKVAMAQICESVGYEGFKESALDALADISVRYLSELGRSTRFYANMAGRTECNLFDIIPSLEDLNGLPGSDSSSCSFDGDRIKSMVNFVRSTEEIPFAEPVSSFPISWDKKALPSFVEMGETPPGKHIPAWLPAFPDRHTYVHTQMWNERASDPQADKLERVRQRRKAERALLSLQQRLVCNSSVGTSVLVVPYDEGPLQQADTNVFLATSVQAGEKDISLLDLPAKLSNSAVDRTHVSLLGAFAPAIEAAKAALPDGADDDRRLLPVQRSGFHVNFKVGKKMVGEPLDLSLQKKGGRRTGFPLRDEERDDKKRRAEFILRHTTENPMELNQT